MAASLPETLEWDSLTDWQDEEHRELLLDGGASGLKPVVGLLDDLPNQRQMPLALPVDQGHLIVYGMPGLGKTTFVQTLLMSLARSRRTDPWHGYIIDMGRMMKDFTGLPQIGGVLMAEEEDRIKRLFRYILKLSAQRKDMISEAGVKTISAYRRTAHAAVPQIVVVIDGYLSFRNAYPEENELLETILREGGSLGITFILTANRVTDVFEKFRSNIPNAVSFELSDPSDYYYAVGRPSKAPSQLPPGRGLVKGQVPPLMFQAALPSSGEDEGKRSSALRGLIAEIRDSWSGEEAPQIAPLPEEVKLKDLLGGTGAFAQAGEFSTVNVPVGLLTDDLEPFLLNLREGPHFMVTSPMEGGKTTFC